MENVRKKFTPNENMILFEEVNGICPKCMKPLYYNKNERIHKSFEIAHIYPLNATDIEKKLLKNEEILSSNLNHLDNLICLCPQCHTKFDKPKTVEEYREIVDIKKELIKARKEKGLWHKYPIEDEIKIILEKLSNNITNECEEELEYNPKKIDEKSDSTIKPLTKRRIKNDVNDYYLTIKSFFKDIEKTSPGSFDLMAIQIKSYYLALKKEKYNQEEIFHNLVNWLTKKTDNFSEEACKIIVSFFIQNCEVF